MNASNSLSWTIDSTDLLTKFEGHLQVSQWGGWTLDNWTTVMTALTKWNKLKCANRFGRFLAAQRRSTVNALVSLSVCPLHTRVAPKWRKISFAPRDRRMFLVPWDQYLGVHPERAHYTGWHIFHTHSLCDVTSLFTVQPMSAFAEFMFHRLTERLSPVHDILPQSWCKWSVAAI